jgi:hypothetical protein
MIFTAKHLSITAIATVTLACATAAWATEVGQPPTGANGSNWTSDVDPGVQQVADNWTAATDDRVVRLRWWGSYYGGPDGGPAVDDFTINIYGHDAEADGPGALLATFLVRNQVRRLPTSVPASLDVFEYRAVLPASEQHPSVPGFQPVAGETYWFNVMNSRDRIGVSFWNWYEGTGGDGDVVFRAFNLPSWQHESLDRAFVVSPRSTTTSADLDGNGTIDSLDILVAMGVFGSTDGGAADLNHDDVVDGRDLVDIIDAFGTCP